MKEYVKPLVKSPVVDADIPTVLPDLTAFSEAFGVLIEAGSETVEKLCAIPVSLERFVSLLKFAKGNKTVHITGMGRSGKVGMAFGELLKTEGLNVAYIGKSHARPVRFGDVSVGFSGSGWTKTTAHNLEDCIRAGATAVSFVGDPLSKIARLSDVSIFIPSQIDADKESRSYVRRNIEGIASPLTPMGTIFEITSMLAASGIAACLEETAMSSPVEEIFGEVCKQVLREAYQNKCRLQRESGLQEMIEELGKRATHAYSHRAPKVYVIGSGMSGIVASMAAVRFSHLGINVQSEYDWRFRNADDLLLAISGSGTTSNVLTYAKLAVETDMKTFAVTSFKDSELAKLANHVTLISGRKGKTSEYDKHAWDAKTLIPSFEYSSALFLDSIVAQIADSLRIDEESMKKEHANVE